MWRVLAVALAVWSIPMAFAAMTLWAQAESGERELDRAAVVRTLVAYPVWALATPAIVLAARRFPLREGRILRSAAAHLLIGLVTVLAVEAVSIGLGDAIVGDPEAPPVWRHMANRAAFIPWGIIFYAVVVAVATAGAGERRAAAQEKRVAYLEAGLAQARLDALRSQLHPHFLFNTLNSISALIRDARNEDATEAVERLSRLLRRAVTSEAVQLAPLDEDLETLEDYLSIERLRLGHRLQVKTPADADARRCHAPVLLLQPLVENAVRHGVSRRSGGSIDLSARVDGDLLIVEIHNQAVGVLEASPDHGMGGVGLENTRRRLSHLFGHKASVELERTEDSATVRVVMPAISSEQGSPR